MNKAYVHGYDPRESRRLQDQATTLVQLLHSDTSYPAGSRVLEAGCGVGAQTLTLSRNNPEASIISMDISRASVLQARGKVEEAGIENIDFLQADIFRLPFDPQSFDHLFLCFVLEHLPRPMEALIALKDFIRPAWSMPTPAGRRWWRASPGTRSLP